MQFIDTSTWQLLIISFLSSCLSSLALFSDTNVLYAVNCGGQAHTDLNGIRYQADYLSEGVASDYGSKYAIARVDPHDAILYQTERYNMDDFSYEIPLPSENGVYTLVLKFCEVYFQSARQKVFDVLLNDEVVVADLDIWKLAGGTGVAFDKPIPFRLKGKTIFVGGTSIDTNKELKLTFAKGSHDNPKINAFYLYKGPESDIPALLNVPEFSTPNEFEETEEPVDLDSDEESNKPKFADGPAVEDPYAAQDNSYIVVPILVAIACFFPIMYCLCKM